MIDMEDNSHLKNVISLPCLRRTDLVGSLGESDWSELRLQKKVMKRKAKDCHDSGKSSERHLNGRSTLAIRTSATPI